MKTVEYPNLLDQTRRAFGEECPAGVKFYYLDEDNELVSISSQNDLEEALEIEEIKVLKLTACESTAEARAALCQEAEDNASIHESLNQSGFFTGRTIQEDIAMSLKEDEPEIAICKMEPTNESVLSHGDNSPLIKEVALPKEEEVEEAKVEKAEEVKVEESKKEEFKGIHVKFNNMTDSKVSTFWINYQGVETHYATIEPKDSYTQQTYIGHEWVIRAEDNSEIARHVGEDKEAYEFFIIDTRQKEECKAEIDLEKIFGKVMKVAGCFMKEVIEAKKAEAAAPKVHPAFCDVCEARIVGIRYKCAVRHDYDLCEACEGKNTHEYPMLKIRDPRQNVHDVKICMQRPRPQFRVHPMMNHFKALPVMDLFKDILGQFKEAAPQEEQKKEQVLIKAPEKEAEKETVIDTTESENKSEKSAFAEDEAVESESSSSSSESEEKVAEADPKEKYLERVACCENEEAREGLTALFEYGFTDFDANLAMLRSTEYSINMAVNGLIDAA